MSRPDPDDLSPREARNLFLDKRRTDSTDWTLQTYHYRLKTFVEWAEENGIGRINDMSGWDIDRYEADQRAEGAAPTTIKGSLTALKKLLEYYARIEAVDDDLPKKIDVPTLSRDEQSNDVMLTGDDAKQRLSYYRNSDELDIDDGSNGGEQND